MSTLPQPLSWNCTNCGQPIDVWWPGKLTADGDPDRWAKLNWPDPTEVLSEALCPACRLQAATAGDRLGVESENDLDRWVWNEIGTPDGATLCVGHDILGTLNAEKRKPEQRETFFARFYTVVVDQWDEALPQPAMEIFANDGRSFVAVIFGAAVSLRSIPVPGLLLFFRSSWHAPHWPMRMEVVGWDLPGVSVARLKELMAGAEAFQAYVARGRSRNTGRWESDSAFLEELDKNLSDFEREGRRVKNMDALADKIGTSRRTLFYMFDKVPGAHNRLEKHKDKRRTR